MMSATSERLGGRYDLQEELGRGGMGAVYRAHDRLTGKLVALKRVKIPPASLMFGSMAWGGTDLSLALAQEFTVLAGLRHPHIISVLDYGFDDQHYPYYTMTLMDNPQTLLKGTQGWSIRRKLLLAMQILEALVYLHRHNILHRDLKPANVLVTPEGEARVVDFGLALNFNQVQAGKGAGTSGYIAPEIYGGYPSTPAADLWPVGIMIFELVTGVHPFDPQGKGVALVNSLYSNPALNILEDALRFDGARLGVSAAPLLAVVTRLLERNPATRYQTASAVLTDLANALDLALTDKHEVREGFLQAAAFVGRDAELSTLTNALHNTTAHQGTAWLIGGESGVGKSRLLDELSTAARVKGVLVLRGQATAERGAALHVWRDLIPMLALHVAFTDAEAAILNPFSASLESVLGRPIGEASPVDAEATLRRASDVLVDILLRLKRPTLILLEDLQWATQSLRPLRDIMRALSSHPLMLVGTFRDDERPDLPTTLPKEMKSLKLARLDEAATIALVQGMLGGDAAAQAPLIDLLQRETEGNAFFLVETVRALAEEAGALAKIGSQKLPEQVLAGGVREVILRRLGRVPQVAQSLLQAAAMMGRQLDIEALSALRQLYPEHFEIVDVPLERWLQIGADAAVLELRDQRWRFSHDKLRETLLTAIPTETGQTYARAIIKMLESIKPQAILEQELAGAMAGYCQQTGDTLKERNYREWAGLHEASLGNFRHAIKHYTRALDLYPAEDYSIKSIRTRAFLVEAYKDLSDHAAAYAILQPLLDNPAVPEEIRWKPYYHLAATYFNQGHTTEGVAPVEIALEGVLRYGTQSDITNVHRTAGNIAMRQGDFAKADFHFEAIKQIATIPSVYADSLYGLAQIAIERHELDKAGQCLEEALTIYEELGNRNAVAETCNLLGIVNGRRENPAALTYFRRALAHMERSGGLGGIGRLQSNIAIEIRKTGDFEGAIEMMHKAIATFQTLDDPFSQAVAMVNLGKTFELYGDDDSAAPMTLRAMKMALANQTGLIYPHALIGLARIAQRQGKLERAGQFAAVIEANTGDARLKGEAKGILDALPAEMQESTRASAQTETLENLVRRCVDEAGVN